MDFTKFYYKKLPILIQMILQNGTLNIEMFIYWCNLHAKSIVDYTSLMAIITECNSWLLKASTRLSREQTNGIILWNENVISEPVLSNSVNILSEFFEDWMNF